MILWFDEFFLQLFFLYARLFTKSVGRSSIRRLVAAAVAAECCLLRAVGSAQKAAADFQGIIVLYFQLF